MGAKIRCWTDYDEWLRTVGRDDEADERLSAQAIGATCFLPNEHRGPHEWTPDSEIAITFIEGA